jgi:beta-lactamase regulating signal transducer with metallopeptidase domain
MESRTPESAPAPAALKAEPLPRRSLFPLRVPGTWLQIGFGVWVVVTLLLLGRVAFSWFTLSRRRKRSTPAAEELQDLASYVGRGPIRVATSNEVDTPLAIGLGRPSILIPQSYSTSLTKEELKQIVLHETAHIARGDDLTLLFQRVVEAILPWHPAVRWIGRKLDVEREIACDDRVVALTQRAREYARCLTRVAELGGETALTTPGAIGYRSGLEQRVDSLLEFRTHPSARLLKGRFMLLAAMLVLVVFGAGRMRSFVAFAQTGAIRGLAAPAQDVVDSSLDAPAELRADILLKLVERKHVTDEQQVRRVLTAAWDLAPNATYASDIYPAANYHTDTDIGSLESSFERGLSRDGLQSRAIGHMAEIDAKATREMFLQMVPPQPETRTCESDRYTRHDRYFKSLEIVLKGFNPENSRPGERTELLRNSLRSLVNPADLESSLALLQKDTVLSNDEYVELITRWSQTLDASRFNDRVFSGGQPPHRLARAVADAAKNISARGGSPAMLLRALRTYLVVHFSGTRCEDTVTSTATIIPLSRPDPSVPRASVVEVTLKAFNDAVTELKVDVLPIQLEEARHKSAAGKAVVVDYLVGDKHITEIRKLQQPIRFGSAEQQAANAARTGRGNENLTLEQRSTPEWNRDALVYLNYLENWSRDLTQSNRQVFFQKSEWYGSIVELAPDGRMRDTILKSYVTFFSTTPIERESPPEWLRWVEKLIDSRNVRDRRAWIDQIEAAGDKTIGAYVKLARLDLK